MAKKSLGQWIVARKRHRLSHAQVQMARELGFGPDKLNKIDNHDQEPWKAPLPQFIEHLYEKRFGKSKPDVVHSIEELERIHAEKHAARTERRRIAREQSVREGSAGEESAGEEATSEPSAEEEESKVPF